MARAGRGPPALNPEVAAAYWTRTLRQYAGRRVRIVTASGLRLEGVVELRDDGPFFQDDTVARPIPVGHLVEVEALT